MKNSVEKRSDTVLKRRKNSNFYEKKKIFTELTSTSHASHSTHASTSTAATATAAALLSILVLGQRFVRMKANAVHLMVLFH